MAGIKVELVKKVKSYRGLFKADLKLRDVDEVLREAIEERRKKWC